MKFLVVVTVVLGLLPRIVPAQEDRAQFRVGTDAFLGGQSVTHAEPGADDLFIAGQKIRIEADLAGSVHAAGQSVTLTAAAGGDVYALGQDVTLGGAVAGDVSVAGQTLRIDGPVGADLRAAGEEIVVNAPVSGYAALAGEEVEINAEIAGDLTLAAEDLRFGEGARVGGRLTIYEEYIGQTVIPPGIAPEDRITRRELDEWEREEWGVPMHSPGAMIARYIGGIVFVALLASLTAALVPDRLAEIRRTILAAPFRTLGIGFLTQSALIGSVFLVAITLIGLLLVPAILLLAGLTALAGYVLAAYAFGVGLMLLAGRAEPDSLAQRALAAAIGALAAGVIGLIPVLGWIFVLALSLTGIGALAWLVFGGPSRVSYR